MKMFKTIGAFGVLALASIATAATTSHYLRVSVPFAFMVAGRHFDAGNYEVKESDNGVVLLQGAGKAASVLTIPDRPAGLVDTTALRFTTTGAGQELVGIELEGADSRAIPMRDLERKATTTSR